MHVHQGQALWGAVRAQTHAHTAAPLEISSRPALNLLTMEASRTRNVMRVVNGIPANILAHLSWVVASLIHARVVARVKILQLDSCRQTRR